MSMCLGTSCKMDEKLELSSLKRVAKLEWVNVSEQLKNCGLRYMHAWRS
jgi:hypothetical protein